MAKHHGATIIATASPDKHEAVRALGADHVVDYRGADVAAKLLRLTDDGSVDLVRESVGGERSGPASLRRVTARVVVYGVAGGEATVVVTGLGK
jgi:NADPH:quinone reductase